MGPDGTYAHGPGMYAGQPAPYMTQVCTSFRSRPEFSTNCRTAPRYSTYARRVSRPQATASQTMAQIISNGHRGLTSALGLSPHHGSAAPKAKVDEFGSLLAREAAEGHGRLYGYNNAGGAGGPGNLRDNVMRLAGVARRASTFQVMRT